MLKSILKMNSLKIRNKLILYFICLIIVPIVGIFLITYLRLSGVIQNKITNYSSVIIRQMCSDMDKTLYNATETRYYVLSNQRVQDILMREDFSSSEFNQDYLYVIDYLKEILSAKEFIRSATLLNNKYFPFFISNLNGDTPYTLEDIKKNNFYDELIKANGKMVWGGFDRRRNASVLGMQVLSKETLKGIGLIIFSFDMRQLNNIVAHTHLENFEKFYILDKNGEIIYSSMDNEVGKTVDGSYFSRLTSSNEEVFVKRNGNESYVTITYPSSVVDWRYVYEVPEEEMMKDFTQSKNFMLFIFNSGIILALLFSILISVGITKPIQRLIKHMKSAEKGNLDTRVKVTTQDEVGQLSEKFNNMIANIQNLINTVYKEELLRRNAEIRMLQAQINPHFLYNTLDSINALAELRGVNEISKVTVAFSKLLRVSISNNKNFVSLKEEISYISNYMTIINIRYNNKINYILELQEETLECRVPKLIIQPLVENSIVHGLEQKAGSCRVVIKSEIVDDSLFIYVKDNGVGMDAQEYHRKDVQDEEELHSGIGLSNVAKRIELIYGSGYGIDIDSKKDEGTAITLRMPVQYSDEVGEGT